MNPRQKVLLSMDVFSLLAEILGDVRGSVIDGGANVGEATERMRRAFPNAEVHAFEPIEEAYSVLERRVQALGGSTSAQRLALGDRAGEAEMHVNRNLWTCSLLPASERGLALHGDWCETVRSERVQVVRLDDWASERGAAPIDVIKFDLQGFEGPALAGCERVLEGVKAIYSEAQIIPEYEGATTFAEIDGFLRNHGFGLYQMTDLCLKGEHAEPSCCDGLWLRSDVLERVRRGPAPRAVETGGLQRCVRMQTALEKCAAEGLRRIALYGAGAHTLACGETLAMSPVEIDCVIDDAADRRVALWGLPVVSRAEAIERGVGAIVLSSDRAEAQLIANCDDALEAGICVVSLYEEAGIRMRTGRAAAAGS